MGIFRSQIHHSKKDMKTKICEVCRKKFRVHNYREKTALYCCRKCKGMAAGGIINGKPFKKGHIPWNKRILS